jgi:hypothetical protein
LVTKVEGSRAAGATSIRKDAKSGAGFAESLKLDETAAAAPASAPQPVAGIAGLLALQEVDEVGSDRAAAQRGDEILDRLDELRRGLLLGQIRPERLAQLARLARDASRQANDPRLAEILGEIELRAEVELAKLQQEGL